MAHRERHAWRLQALLAADMDGLPHQPFSQQLLAILERWMAAARHGGMEGACSPG